MAKHYHHHSIHRTHFMPPTRNKTVCGISIRVLNMSDNAEWLATNPDTVNCNTCLNSKEYKEELLRRTLKQ